VITVAHRLNTVADYDTVVVMAKGRLIEAGSPWELLQRKDAFFDMVSYTGKNAQVITTKAKTSYEVKHMRI
jgi:ABC-type multidrug transport system fused ATPase/permease subunit